MISLKSLMKKPINESDSILARAAEKRAMLTYKPKGIKDTTGRIIPERREVAAFVAGAKWAESIIVNKTKQITK